MIRTTREHRARLLVVTAAVLLAWPFGCSSVLGLSDWSDPPGLGGGTTTSSTTSGTQSSTVTTTTTSTRTLNVTDAGATCDDAVKNGSETDVDCGGDACLPCSAGKTCNDGADCQSGNCAPGGCAGSLCCQSRPPDAGPPDADPTNPTCADGVKNGMETDVDCGGDACPPCASGKACGNDADCKSGHCPAAVCL
jgi:hypothetical protein